MVFSNVSIALLLPVAALWAWNYFEKRSRNPNGLPYPPGPKGRLILGNALEMPVQRPWLKFAEWSREYGDIISLNILGRRIVVISSAKTANEIFDQRSAKYSSRVSMPMIQDLQVPMGYKWSFAFMPYGEAWRQHRRAFHSYFQQREVHKIYPIQLRESRALLRRLLDTPEDLLSHCRLLFGATILDATYGLKVTSPEDSYVTNAERVLRSIWEASTGTYWVNFLPVLKYVPEWFPNAGFKRKATVWREWADEFLNKPWDAVKSNLDSGTARPCFATTIMEQFPEDDAKRSQEEAIARGAAALAYKGGADTTIAATQVFFIAMCMFPDVQKRAQEELDRVVGPDRLPEFGDREHLPYICAVVKETTRWIPVASMGVPHCSTADDVYNGYFIPKGSIVMGNAWAILHDPEQYPDPMAFKPERFLTEDGKANPEVPDPEAAFGYGRRICPGRFLSDNSMYGVIASVLYAFTIAPPLDESGNPIQLEHKAITDLVVFPLPFECIVKPRSEQVATLVRETVHDD
ncbi:hypothetical protein EW146_g2521 [Bondarzewia mesenterica]|uniref:O-methylsterigmatocystin oxidoreductase n=1 Tax=Bondarzewia mesenterica TaxID=1095465 RepID=A0A4V3XFQ9_9AGAM|nr:hypothetical protein EW146_g2521 [Bondarzewia mesenterica]